MEQNKKDIYEDNEELEILVNFGKEGSKFFLPEGTRVNHMKTVDNPNDLTKSLVVAKYTDPVSEETRVIIIKETDVKPVKEKTVKVAFQEFNEMMMQTNPELRIYHPNIFKRYYYRIYYFFKKRFGSE